MKKGFTKFFTILTALLFLGITNAWGATETVPKTTDNWTGISCSLTHAECANGSANAKKDGDASDVTYIKFRTNKNGNTMTFEVNSGYKVTGLSIRGYANDNSKDVGLTSVKYDSADPIAVNQSFPNKSAGTTYTYSNTTNEATSAIVLSFGTNAGTQIMAVITITYEELGDDTDAPTLSGSVPANGATDVAVDGTIVLTFSEAIANVDGTKFSLSGATIGTVAIDGSDATKVNVPYSGADNSSTVTLSVAAEAVADAAGNKSAALSDIAFTTVAAITPACPSGLSIGGTAAYTEGETISLTATLTEGNGTITYTWYKGSIAAGNEVGTNSNVLTIASCATSDAGNYYCVASKDGCADDAESSAFAVTVSAASYCVELNPATSGDEPVLGTIIDMQTGSYGGSIKVVGRKQSGSFAYTANGLTFNKGGVDSVHVTLNHLIQVGTKIHVTVNNQDGTKDQGFYLQNISRKKKADMHRQNGSTGDTTYVYTAVAGDGLVGINEFIIARGSSSAALKSLKVSNCGAELFDLTSAVDPVGEATVTLSASKVVAGGSATASYTINDPTAYDFDEWVISSGDATIADSHAATAAITMGTGAATITLKLKAAGAKHTVTYYDGAEDPANKLGDELVDEGENPTGAGLAPHKLGYTFAGWSTTNGGSATALSGITVDADLSLFAVWNAVDCANITGTFYTMSIAVAPAANCTIKTATGYESTWDLYQYEGVSGGEATIGNTGGSNNCILTTDKTILLKDNASYLKLDFDCALKEGDTIKSNVTGSGKAAFISTDATRPEESAAKAILSNSATGKLVVPAALDGETTIYIWKGGGNVTITSINIIRPEKFAVTFNMHGHGDAVAEQSVIAGGKVAKPTDPTASGWDFEGWFKESTFDNEWDFDNDVVNAATEIHAKWTAHTTSTDASLSDLQVNGVTVPGFSATQLAYDVELPMGTTAAPTVTATANDANAVATVTSCTLTGATIEVVPESGVDDKKIYTLTFSVATSKGIQLVFKTGSSTCVGSASTATQILSNNAAVSTYINQITFTNVEGSGDDGAEGSSLNVGKKAGNMFTLSAKDGYAFQAMNFLAKIQDATCEFSLDGGAWTELASTNTGGDVCYAPFSAAEVHEFRLRSTGAQGVWIRNMQLTIIEASAPTPETVRTGLEVGRYYTICLPKKVVAATGATFWSMSERNTDTENPLAYIVEENLPLTAGQPFLFQATATTLEVTYEGEATTAGSHGALHGTLDAMDQDALNAAAGANRLYILKNNELRLASGRTGNSLAANRAYIIYEELHPVSTPSHAPGRQVRSMPLHKDVATGLDDLNADTQAQKVILNGQLFIIRGEKMYDATGILVK